MDKVLNLDACIKCSSCLAKCPVAAVNPLFSGPKMLGPDLERFRLDEGMRFDYSTLDFCSNCKTCEVTCPSGVKITDLILRAKGKGKKDKVLNKNEKLKYHLRDGILGRAEYLGKLGVIWPELMNRVLKAKALRRLLEVSLGIAREAPLPVYGRKFVNEQNLNLGKKQVIYFPGCFTKYNNHLTGEAVLKVLRHNGFEVLVPDFKCCGVPLEANNRFKQAERNMIYNLKLISKPLMAGVQVLTSCTSCSLHLKEEYPKLEIPEAQLIGKQSLDLFEFLWSLYEQGQLNTDFSEIQAALGYHEPCHLKAQGIGIPSLRILKLIPGVKVFDLDSECCGLSGSYGLKQEKYRISMEVGTSLFERAKEGFEERKFHDMITECGICQLQLLHGTGLSVYHPIWILIKAYRLSL